jgi:hypothetical protein
LIWKGVKTDSVCPASEDVIKPLRQLKTNPKQAPGQMTSEREKQKTGQARSLSGHQETTQVSTAG